MLDTYTMFRGVRINESRFLGVGVRTKTGRQGRDLLIRQLLSKGQLIEPSGKLFVGMNEVEMRCTRCNEVLATVAFEGQLVRVGRAEIYTKVRLFCICGKASWTWQPSTLPDDEWTPSSYRTSKAIRLSLARKRAQVQEK